MSQSKTFNIGSKKVVVTTHIEPRDVCTPQVVLYRVKIGKKTYTVSNVSIYDIMKELSDSLI